MFNAIEPFSLWINPPFLVKTTGFEPVLRQWKCRDLPLVDASNWWNVWESNSYLLDANEISSLWTNAPSFSWKKARLLFFCRALNSLIIAGVVTRFDFIGFSTYPLKSFYNLFRADTAKFPRPIAKHSGCAVLLLSRTDHIDRSFIISLFLSFF